MLASTRRGIPYPNPDRSDAPDIPAHIKNLVDALDVDVIYTQGTNAARIAAAHTTSGGSLWWTTDTLKLWYDDGTTWRDLTPTIASDSITQVELAPLSVGTPELINLAVTAAKIANDTITAAQIAADAVGSSELDETQSYNFTAVGGLRAQSMRVHRHPYGSDRHIESGKVTHSASAVAVSFTDAFSVAPAVTTSNDIGGQVYHSATSIGTTGFTINSVGAGGGNAGGVGQWMAEGAD